jgi:SAM-dependent methyltransferase
VYFVGYGPHQSEIATAQTPPANALVRIAAPPLRALGVALGSLPGVRLSRALRRTYTPDRPGATLLDYGCGAPIFLDRARERGWNTVGVDFANDVVEAVRANGHAAFCLGDDYEAGVDDGSVECARMNHVVEHLYEPVRVLESIRRKMRPGGRIHLATPNPDSLGSRYYGRHWWGLECPRHALLYRPRLLVELLERAGFHTVTVLHEAAAKDLARSWGIRRTGSQEMSPTQIGALAHDRVRVSLFSPAAAASALVSAADRYHTFARA